MRRISQEAFAIILCIAGITTRADDTKEIKGHAPPGNYIIHEEYTSNLDWNAETISISTNAPLTVQRYYDDYFVEGMQPLGAHEAKVLVTSNCAATTYIPEVTWGNDSIAVNVQGAPSDMPYLANISSWYHASWSHESWWCPQMPQTEVPTRSPQLQYEYDLASTSEEEFKNRLNGGRPFSLRSKISSCIKSLARRSMQSLQTTRDTTKEEEKAEEESTSSRQLYSSSSSAVCNVNVEVMIDSCSHNADVSAPTVRVIDNGFNNTKSSQDPDDDCVSILETDILYDSDIGTISGSPLVPQIECHRPVPGRPFVDSVGKILQASPVDAPLIREGKVWSGEGLHIDESSPVSSFDNRTTTAVASENQSLLGKEFTKNALGEHASVASFSAFAIALLTNQAPSDLIESALQAALEEVKHAEVSFRIASTLTGHAVVPGPLPESTHHFQQDLAALTIAVANEGCVDETLSALEVAAEVDLINIVLEYGSDYVTKYSGIDRDMLMWIRDELQTIASEEAGHAALAWRTIEWVCKVDSEACSAVKKQVLNVNELEKAFQHRFMAIDSSSEAWKIMNQSWKMIYSRDDSIEDVCSSSTSIVWATAQKIVQGVVNVNV